MILISSYLSLNSAYSYGAQDILEPSHLLSCQYSKLHNPKPKSIDPNIACLTWGILVVEVMMNDLSISLSKKHLCSMMAGTVYAYEYDPYLRSLLECEHSQNYISVSTNDDSDLEYLLEELHNDISLPIQDDYSKYLSNVNYYGSFNIQQN